LAGTTALGRYRSRHDSRLTEVAALIAELESIRFVGRNGYGSLALLGACIVKALYALPTWTRVADLIAEHPGLSDALGGTP
jgi:hypothetical protein